MPRFYSHRLKGTLQDQVEILLGASPSEQLSLFEELALMRVTAAQVVALWGAAEGTDAAPMAGVLMRDALKDVISTCQTAANIESQAKDKFSIHALHHIINQIVRIAYECFDEDPRAERFEQLIKEKIKMPIEQTGTLLTPDQDAVDMDDTIPKE